MDQGALFWRLYLAAPLLGLLWLAESRIPLVLGRTDRARHALRNLAFPAVNFLPLALIFSILTVAVAEVGEQGGWGLFRQLNWPSWLEATLALFLCDGWMYLWHRANHRIPFLWRFHSVHHSDRELDATSAFRFHIGEVALAALLRLGVITLVGIGIEQVILYELVLLPIILFHHSNLSLPEPLDRCLRVLIVTPRMHHLHHSPLRTETDSNYSSVFS